MFNKMIAQQTAKKEKLLDNFLKNYEGKLPVMFNLHGGGFLLGKPFVLCRNESESFFGVLI